MEVNEEKEGKMKGQTGAFTLGSFFSHPSFSLERESLWTGIYTFILLGIAEFFLYTGFLGGIENFGSRFGPFLILLIAALAINSAGVWYIKSIKSKVTCMTGCMSGMTLGMVGGFTLGAVVGATNGMLIGSIYGLVAGIALGAFVGKCCGTMGIMQGMMAGLMGGVMGAMTSLMLISENVFIFLWILMAVSAVMMGGLIKIFRKETEGNATIKSPDRYSLLAINIFVLIITLWLFAFGPRSVIVASITTWGA